MTDIAIKVENLSKRYRLGMKDELHDTFTGALTSFIKSPFANFKKLQKLSKFSENGKAEDDILWALKDVSFEVKHGEVVGIIGRNGAGKSTLLKILSRITEPTSGKVTINGRVSSLLEVGTGFHPELTGRENIYLNGTILGMTKKEIDSKFDEIVDFSGVEKFIDTPVKRYSSGMQVRLAFAVAAYLEPEILVIDEVLAVGDYEFQKKCLGKMQDVAESGRTVLFVSHNMKAVEQLCSRAILITNGTISVDRKSVTETISLYMFGSRKNQNIPVIWENEGDNFSNPYFLPTKFYMGTANTESIQLPINKKDEVWIYIEGISYEYDPSCLIGYTIYNEHHIIIYSSFNKDFKLDIDVEYKNRKIIYRTKIPVELLNEGTYTIELATLLHLRKWLIPFGSGPKIYLTIQGGMDNSPFWQSKRAGVLSPKLEWEIITFKQAMEIEKNNA